ncbi:hypothetical protein CDIK_3937 [Cucumispora dikerogammari]|nr:hypothetical protein CDIK_3937 [Cucumispora dikerogammari]
MIIFYSSRNKRYLKESTILLMDGTFKSSPASFYQLYTAHTQIFGKTCSFIYVLMTTKNKQSPIRLFQYLSETLKIQPKYIIVDVEVAVIAAARLVFVSASVETCLFHFGQSICKKVQTLKLSENYKKDEKTKSIVRRCLYLSFVKTDKIETEFQQLKEKYKNFIRKNEQINQFITYFQQTYIGETGNIGVYVLSLFKKEL